jgi:hypothetical protein
MTNSVLAFVLLLLNPNVYLYVLALSLFLPPSLPAFSFSEFPHFHRRKARSHEPQLDEGPRGGGRRSGGCGCQQDPFALAGEGGSWMLDECRFAFLFLERAIGLEWQCLIGCVCVVLEQGLGHSASCVAGGWIKSQPTL